MSRSDIKASWYIDGEHHVTMCEPRPHPCNHQCPWLVANHGRTVALDYDHEVPGIGMPDAAFTFAPWKRAQVWRDELQDGRHGFGSVCHVRLRGTGQRADDTWDVVSHQCTGAHVMQQREVLRHVETGTSALTPAGAARIAAEMLGCAVTEPDLPRLDVARLLAHAHPALLDPSIGSEVVAPPLTSDEIERWRRLQTDSAARLGAG